MAFGWAYVDCSGSGGSGGGGQAAGPTGSVQFLTGANATSGSARLLFHTAAYQDLAGNTLLLSGNMVVRGDITASAFRVHQTDIISGSTVFGNDRADTHVRTGSLYVGDQSATIFEVATNLSQSRTFGFRVGYQNVSNLTNPYTASTKDYILGVSATGSVNIRLPSAATAGAGSLLVIKDQLAVRGLNSIFISGAGGDQVDGANYYELTGTMPAISLYSNGSDWFVF